MDTKKTYKTPTSAGNPLFENLRALRTKLAQAQQVPPYVIFSDRTLTEMAEKCPKTEAELAKISGIGAVKLQKYGQAFLEVLNAHGGIPAKAAFFLTPEEAAQFPYGEALLVSEIRQRMNALKSGETPVQVKQIMQFLLDSGYIAIARPEESTAKTAAEKGIAAGILTEDRQNPDGRSYQVLRYPIGVQREIVGFFTVSR